MSDELTKTVLRPGGSPKTGRRGRFFLNLLLGVAVIGAVGLFIWAEQQRRLAVSQLQRTSAELEEIRQSTQRSAEELANEVITKVRKHIDIPADPKPTMATIVDVDRLRQSSDFYKDAANGDNLIITNTRAILYDPKRDIIRDVVPIAPNQQTPVPSQSPNVSGVANPPPSTLPTPSPSSSPSFSPLTR